MICLNKVLFGGSLGWQLADWPFSTRNADVHGSTSLGAGSITGERTLILAGELPNEERAFASAFNNATTAQLDLTSFAGVAIDISDLHGAYWGTSLGSKDFPDWLWRARFHVSQGVPSRMELKWKDFKPVAARASAYPPEQQPKHEDSIDPSAISYVSIAFMPLAPVDMQNFSIAIRAIEAIC
ncbi:hypothetical protein PYCC9005_003512 [Savitreella phatthalungensis]